MNFNRAIIKNKGTPNLLNSSDNIDGTQTFLTQLSAVKLKSIEKRGKIQTTKMNKFSNLNICSTKREPNPQWPLTATIGLNFWSELGSPIPMTSQWPQTTFARLLLIWSPILDLSSTGLIKKRGTQCFKSRKREPCTTHFLYRILDSKKTSRFQFSVPDLREIHRNLKQQRNFNYHDGFFRKSPFCTFSCINPGFGGSWGMLWIFFLNGTFLMLQKNTFGSKVPFWQFFNFSKMAHE